MYFTGVSLAGSPEVPNEDWSATTSDLIVVLDGATVRTETGCEHDAAWFARKLGVAIIGNAASRSTSLADVLAVSISDVAALHPQCQLSHPGTPSAGVAVVRLEGDHLRYLVLGDVTVALDTRDGVRTIADQRISTSAARERQEADRHSIGTPEKHQAMVAMKHAELAARGREYWVAASYPSAADHALTGAIEVRAVQRLAVMTDGAARWVEMFDLGDWRAAIESIAWRGPRAFIDRIRDEEIKDFAGVTHPRNKRSDDATVVYAMSSRFSCAAPATRGALPPVTRPGHRIDEGVLFGAVPARNGKCYE